MDKIPTSSVTNKSGAAATLQTLDNWQVLSPVAILYFIAGVFKHLFGNFIYVVSVLALSYKSLLQHPFIWLPSIAVTLALLILFAFTSFKVYRYRLTKDTIEIRSGIFSRKHLNLPFSRVQNIKIEQPLYYRFSGHACLHFDTAGSAKSEATLAAIKLDLAQQLKIRVQSHVKSTATAATQKNTFGETSQMVREAAASPIQQEIVLNQRELSDLVIHGITSNRIWILLGGLAPFYDNIYNSIGEWLPSLGINLTELFSLHTHSLFEVAVYLLSLTMLVVLLLVSFSVMAAIVSYYGYTLSKLDDKYIRRSGLFTKHEVSMGLSRLQMIVQKQDWLDVLLKRINLRFEQNNAFADDLSPPSISNIIVPSITANQCQTLINHAYPNNALNVMVCNHRFEAISKRFILRNILFILMPGWLIIISNSLMNNELLLATLISILFVALSGLVVLRWKRWGIATDENFVYLRKGLIGVDYYCFPTYKLQQTQFKQNLLMKKRQLATVKFVLASGSLTVPLLNEKLAYKLINRGLYQVVSCDKSWM